MQYYLMLFHDDDPLWIETCKYTECFDII